MTTETLGELMKRHEHAARRRVDPTSYLLIRLDGRAFHTYCRGLDKPFDAPFMAAMDGTLQALCREVQGVRFGYVQSDEISLLLTPWKDVTATDSNPSGVQHGEAWMGGTEAKILSLTAALATGTFNRIRAVQRADELSRSGETNIPEALALFDSRLWTFPSTEEGRDLVGKYFLWRQRDAFKNAITMAALSRHSPRELHRVNTAEKIAMLAGSPLAKENIPGRALYGGLATRESRPETVTYFHGKERVEKTVTVDRTHWVLDAFVDPTATESLIPKALA